MTDKTEYQITPYNWSDYLVACVLTIAVLFSPNLLAGIPISIVIQILAVYSCFRTAKLDLNGIKYKTIFFQSDISWSDISRITLRGSWLQKKNLIVKLKSGKRIKFFVQEENLQYILKISKEKRIKFEDDGELLKR